MISGGPVIRCRCLMQEMHCIRHSYYTSLIKIKLKNLVTLMSRLFKIISELDTNKINLIATVIDGEFKGEKIIFSDGQTVYLSHEEGFLSRHRHVLSGMNESGIVSIDGTRVFCELIGGEKKLVICGGGHISIPIIQIGKILDFHVCVLEDRVSFADDAKRAGADNVICDGFSEGLSQIEGDKDTFFVIVTRGHRYDLDCLEGITQKENAYIGMIGSRLKVKKIKEALIEKGVSPENLDKVFAPIGLKISAETPSEIAVAIMAEIVQVKNTIQRSEGFTKEILSAAANDSENIGMALVTIVSKKGSAPRKAGTKMLVREDGTLVGTIGGGCIEADIRQKALWTISSGKPQLCTVDITGQEAENDGMVCGGIIEVFMEPV
jgi:xanthine dehydrogenase accessory factor